MPLMTIVTVPDENSEILQGLAQISSYLRVSRETAQRWIRIHGMPAMKRPRGDWYTTKRLIERWIVARGIEERRANGWAA